MAEEKNDGQAQSIDRLVAEQNIYQAALALGLTFAEVHGFIVYDPDASTAYWTYNRHTGEESIHIGPRIAAYPADTVEMVLRHEILHRSVYHGFFERYDNPELCNLVLDICINRLLFEAYPDKMKEASRLIYPEESKKNIIALADCSANPVKIDPEWQGLWRQIWDQRPDGSFTVINPASLYYRLLKLGDIRVVWVCSPFGPPVDTSEMYPSPRMGKAIDKVIGDFGRHLPKGSGMGKELEEFSVAPKKIGTAPIEDFLKRLRVRRIVDATCKKITEPLMKKSSLDPYPLFPSRLGLIYMALGISDQFYLYRNQSSVTLGSRLAIGIYMDVSGSMIDFFPFVSYFVSALKEYPLKLKTFDTEVREINPAELASGKIRGGGGTDFDAPIVDYLDDPELMACLIFTDGYSEVSVPVAMRLKKMSKPVYTVYLMDGNPQEWRGLDKYSDRIFPVYIDKKFILDLLS